MIKTGIIHKVAILMLKGHFEVNVGLLVLGTLFFFSQFFTPLTVLRWLTVPVIVQKHLFYFRPKHHTQIRFILGCTL